MTDDLFEMLEKIREKASNENEKSCISAVITLFKNIDDLEFLNKRAIFVYLREISGLTPKQLSVSMSNLRKHYRDLVKQDDNFVLKDRDHILKDYTPFFVIQSFYKSFVIIYLMNLIRIRMDFGILNCIEWHDWITGGGSNFL